MAAASKDGESKNITLAVPPFKEVENQIIGVKFVAFKEYYRVRVGSKYEIKVRDLRPYKYFAYDPEF